MGKLLSSMAWSVFCAIWRAVAGVIFIFVGTVICGLQRSRSLSATVIPNPSVLIAHTKPPSTKPQPHPRSAEYGRVRRKQILITSQTQKLPGSSLPLTSCLRTSAQRLETRAPLKGKVRRAVAVQTQQSRPRQPAGHQEALTADTTFTPSATTGLCQ